MRYVDTLGHTRLNVGLTACSHAEYPLTSILSLFFYQLSLP